MPPSSSAKKVARVAARSGSGQPAGAAPVKRRNWLFPAAIAAIVAVGIGLIVFSAKTFKDSTKNDVKPRAQTEPGKPFDHWHAAFAINVCGKEVDPAPEPPTDPEGIHTHGDGLIHIHPFSVSAAGKRARMGKYWDLVELTVTDKGFSYKDAATGKRKAYKEGETTCGGKATELVMAHWKDGQNAASSKPDKIIKSGFASTRFSEDLGAYTLALVPKGETDVPAPSSAKEIVTLGGQDGGGSGSGNPPSQEGGSTPETVPGEAPAESTAPQGGG